MVSGSGLTKGEMMKRYRARKTTVFKKAEELSTLCNVDVLLIFYGPDKPNIPQVWCSKPDCKTIIDEFLGKKMTGNGVKGGKDGKKQGLDVGDDEFIGKLSLDELKNLNKVLAGKIDYVEKRINLMEYNCFA